MKSLKSYAKLYVCVCVRFSSDSPKLSSDPSKCLGPNSVAKHSCCIRPSVMTNSTAGSLVVTWTKPLALQVNQVGWRSSPGNHVEGIGSDLVVKEQGLNKGEWACTGATKESGERRSNRIW